MLLYEISNPSDQLKPSALEDPIEGDATSQMVRNVRSLNYLRKHLTPQDRDRIQKRFPDLTIKSPPGLAGRFNFENPFYMAKDASEGPYVGPPESYPDWTPQGLALYGWVKEILERYGVSPMKMMYSVRYPLFNYVVFNPERTFVLRKYDKGHGAGNNVCYISGKKMNTSEFVCDLDTRPLATRLREQGTVTYYNSYILKRRELIQPISTKMPKINTDKDGRVYEVV